MVKLGSNWGGLADQHLDEIEIKLDDFRPNLDLIWTILRKNLDGIQTQFRQIKTSAQSPPGVARRRRENGGHVQRPLASGRVQRSCE